MTDEPKSIAVGEITIGRVRLVVHTLDNGQRVIESNSVERFFEYLAEGGDLTAEDAWKIAQLLRS